MFWSDVVKGTETQSANVENGIYNLRFTLPANSIVAIWQNGKPVISRQIFSEGEYSVPVELSYGKNELQVLILDAMQRIIFQNHYSINFHNALIELRRVSVDRGSRELPRIALTFDGGANDNSADTILSILQQKGIRCTMFLTGRFMKNHPELVLRMLQAGHEIGNHTFDHPHLTTYSQNGQHQTLPFVNRQFIMEQLQKTDSLFFSLTGQHLAPYWRAPYGEFNDEILFWAAEAGYQHIHWTPGYDTFDWVSDQSSPLFSSSRALVERFFSDTPRYRKMNGAIFLMHLGNDRKDPLHNHLALLIDKLIERGYQPVTISQLLFE